MRVFNVSDRIHYTITPSASGVTLCVWETARVTDSRERPFLFKINQRLSSKEEAQRLLREYLEGFG